MLSEQDYFLYWCFYLLGVTALLVTWWFMTRRIPFRIVRDLLRLTVALLLIVPYSVFDEAALQSEEQARLAPALVVSALEGLFVNGGTFSRAGIPLLMTIVATLIIYVVLDLAWRLGLEKRWREYRQRKAREDDQIAERDALMQESQQRSSDTNEKQYVES